MPAPYFDRYITVDWNASKSPTRKPEDSIWMYVLDADGTPSKPKNLRTRGAAEVECGTPCASRWRAGNGS